MFNINVSSAMGEECFLNLLPSFNEQPFNLTKGPIEPFCSPVAFLNEQFIYIITLDHLVYNPLQLLTAKLDHAEESTQKLLLDVY